MRSNFSHFFRFLPFRFLAWVPLLSLVLAWVTAENSRRIVIVGDSTVMTYTDANYPQSGWGQELIHFFQQGSVTIDNRAIGGRSSRSFIEEGRWETVKATLQSGDFVLIQFGHNDRDTKPERYTDTAQYRKFLTQYVTESRAKGAIPVLVSPMNMNAWNGATMREVFNEGANDYYTAMGRVVKALTVPFIDLEKKSHVYFLDLGKDYITKYLFLGLDAGEYPNFPDGISDGTHFQEMGALAMAKFVAEGIQGLKAHADVGTLASRLAPLYPLTVVSNKASGGTVTVSGAYPAGAPLTFKVTARSGETFQGWQIPGSQTLSTKRMHALAMPAEATTVYALFKGGTTNLAGSGPWVTAEKSMRLRLLKGGDLEIHSPLPILELRLFGLQGQMLYHQRPAADPCFLPAYLWRSGCALSVQTQAGTQTMSLPLLPQ